MVQEIVHIGHPVLRKRAETIASEKIGSAEIQDLIEDLIDTKRAANGAGIAAPQIGIAKRVFIVEVRDNPRYPYKPETPLTVVVNPEITFLSDERYLNYEGCLSIPDLRGAVERCPHIMVKGMDRFGEPFRREVRGITAGTFQHEMDHLDGILFPDRVVDTHTLCTWAEFRQRHEASFRRSVEQLIEKWGE